LRSHFRSPTTWTRVFTDEPFNVAIGGDVTGGDHREFVMASGEMTDAQFLEFNQKWMDAVLPYLVDGGILGTFIDWRGLPIAHAAATALGLTPLSLVVWAKTNAGMGSLYRSQHELLPLFKKGTASHVNNISLGKRGRHRTNLWTYPGASSLGSDARQGLQDHPTVKPTAMLQDALIDLTNRGEIILDPFLGSGSTLIAAENTGRVCCASSSIRFTSMSLSDATRRKRAQPLFSPTRARPSKRLRTTGGTTRATDATRLWRMPDKPEQKARREIDADLKAAGWIGT
jgi:hypothetical protein